MSDSQRILRQLAGWSLVALGLVGLLLPMVPGSLFIAIGALLLARHVRLFRRVSAWMHKRFPHLRGPLRRFRDFKARHAHAAAPPSQADPGQNPLAKPAPSPQAGPDEKPFTRHRVP